MKNHSFIVKIIIFSSILLGYILPPFSMLFLESKNESLAVFSTWSFPWQQLFNALFAFFIFLYKKFSNNNDANVNDLENATGAPCTINDINVSFLRFPLFLTVGLLFCSSLIMKFFAEVFVNNLPSVITDKNIVQLPTNAVQWIFCILTFLFAAFFEEVIYRFYFVDALIELFNGKFVLFFEILGCLVFAFAHYYLGWFSVINAVFGHIILRICYKKNKTLYPSVAAHFIYNVISLILL